MPYLCYLNNYNIFLKESSRKLYSKTHQIAQVTRNLASMRQNIIEQCPHFMTTTQHINMQSIMNKERTITKTQANHLAKLHNEIQECANVQHETHEAINPYDANE